MSVCLSIMNSMLLSIPMHVLLQMWRLQKDMTSPNYTSFHNIWKVCSLSYWFHLNIENSRTSYRSTGCTGIYFLILLFNFVNRWTFISSLSRCKVHVIQRIWLSFINNKHFHRVHTQWRTFLQGPQSGDTKKYFCHNFNYSRRG